MGINSNNPPEIQTDKAKTKIVECAIADCGQRLVVNVFYAPARARCSRHRDEDSQVVVSSAAVEKARVATEVGIPTQVMAKLPVPPAENYSLEKLRCPFGHGPMTILSIHPTMGFVTFKCGDCKTAVEVMPNWAALRMRVIPKALQKVVEQYNEEMRDQGAAYVQTEAYRRKGWD